MVQYERCPKCLGLKTSLGKSGYFAVCPKCKGLGVIVTKTKEKKNA